MSAGPVAYKDSKENIVRKIHCPVMEVERGMNFPLGFDFGVIFQVLSEHSKRLFRKCVLLVNGKKTLERFSTCIILLCILFIWELETFSQIILWHVYVCTILSLLSKLKKKKLIPGKENTCSVCGNRFNIRRNPRYLLVTKKNFFQTLVHVVSNYYHRK